MRTRSSLPMVLGLVTVLMLPLAARAERGAWQPEEGRDLLGTRAPELRGLTWIRGGPLTLAALRGKVVLVRFWTDGCPLCTRSLPALDALGRRHGGRGLVVIGVHHPKAEASRDPAVIRGAAAALGLAMPIATDPDWATVRAFGVGTTFQRFTSVSVLIDRAGVIRFVHDGGELHPGGGPGHESCNAAFAALERAIGEALRR